MPQTVRLEKGKQYRVIKPCRLSWWEPSGPWSWSGRDHELNVGDIITYKGTGYSGGSDGIYEDRFSLEGVIESSPISCNRWGSTLNGYLEDI